MGVATTLQPPTTSKTLQKQHLEAVGAYQYVLTFLFMGPFFSLLVFVLLFTSLWPFSVFYLVWLYVDWDTPNQGGRRSEWIRNRAIWRQLRDYYPVKLVKTAELPPDRNYVLGAHPHGIMCTGFLCNFSTESNGFSQLFPGLRPWLAVLAGLFYLPVYRDYIMSFGRPWCPCTPLGRMTSLDLRLLPQAPGSIGASSPSRSSWASLLASSGVAVSSQPPPGACCPLLCPSPLWWAAPSPSPSASTPPRRKSITITPST